MDAQLAKKVIAAGIVISERTAAVSHAAEPDGYGAGYDAGYVAGLQHALKVLQDGYEE